MVPSFDGSDDLIWIGGPGEGFGVFVGFGNEAIDGGLEIDEGMEDTPLEAPFCEFGEEAFDGVEPRGGCWREVENKPLVAIEPGPDLRMLMGGVVVEDDVDSLVRRDLSVDHVEEADELLVPVAMHIAPDNRPVEDVQSGEKRRGSIAFVVVGHGAETPLLHGQSRLGAVQRLDLAFLIDGQDDGVGGRIDIQPNDIAQFADEVRIVRELEPPIAVRLQTMATPDATDRAFTDANCHGHHQSRPMGRFDGRVRQRQRRHALDHFEAKRRDARWPCFVTQKAVDAFLHEPLLPAPDAGLRFARPAHDLVRSGAVRTQKDDCREVVLYGTVTYPSKTDLLGCGSTVTKILSVTNPATFYLDEIQLRATTDVADTFFDKMAKLTIMPAAFGGSSTDRETKMTKEIDIGSGVHFYYILY